MLPNKEYLRRGDIRRCYGLSNEQFDDLIAAEVFRPVYLTIPKIEKLPAWRRRKLPKKRYAHFRRADVLKAEAAGKIVAAR